MEPPPPAGTRPTLDVRRSARAVAGRPFSVIVDVGGASAEQIDLFWYARRRHRLRCGEPNPLVDFTCRKDGSVYTFTLTPTRAGPRKYNVRMTGSDGRMTKTPTYRVRFGKAG